MFGFETKRELRDRLQQVERRESSYTASIVALLSNSVILGRLYGTPDGYGGPGGV